jgi:acetyl esterase/lipase
MDWAAVAPQLRARYDASLAPLLAKWRARYPVKVEETVIGGVPVAIVEPEAGPAPRNRNKILINLHGGAFIVGGGRGGLIESVPVAAIGGYRVVSVDYRMAPEHLYPAASEDVAAVYGALLKTFTAEDIGLYGCSSGGTLVAQSLVWFARHALPRPGAAGVLCASLDPNFGGDSVYTSALLTGLPPVAPPRPGVRWPGSGSTPYMAKADLLDAAASPLQHPEALKRFPPTLFMTATRAPEMSAAVTSHNRLRSLGVEAELYVWDGLWHGFAGDPDLPESIAFQEAIVRFFDAHLP